MNDRYYSCNACRYSQLITDEGVDAMREHLKTHKGREVFDAYVVIKRTTNRKTTDA